jgi:hypothetical protein
VGEAENDAVALAETDGEEDAVVVGENDPVDVGDSVTDGVWVGECVCVGDCDGDAE